MSQEKCERGGQVEISPASRARSRYEDGRQAAAPKTVAVALASAVFPSAILPMSAARYARTARLRPRLFPVARERSAAATPVVTHVGR